MAYNHLIYKPNIGGSELFIRMQYFMAYNHLIYKPKICGLELFIRMQLPHLQTKTHAHFTRTTTNTQQEGKKR